MGQHEIATHSSVIKSARPCGCDPNADWICQRHQDEATTCPNCGAEDLSKIKGCVRCLSCGFKFDCNGW